MRCFRPGFFPYLIGAVLDSYCATGKEIVQSKIDGILQNVEIVHYNYILPMAIFVGCGLFAMVFALLLKAEDKKKGYGLELPNPMS